MCSARRNHRGTRCVFSNTCGWKTGEVQLGASRRIRLPFAKKQECIARGNGAMMPARARRETAMRRVSCALRMVLIAGLCGSTWVSGALAGAGGQANFTDKLKNLEFREIGSATMGGRLDDFAGVEHNPNIVFVGGAAGGVWETVYNGTDLEAG